MAVYFWRELIVRVNNWWQKTEDDLVGSIKDILVHMGCWGSQGRQDGGKFYFRLWLPQFSLTVAMTLSLIFSPISVYKFREKDVTQILEAAGGMVLLFTEGLHIGSFLYRAELFDEVIAAFRAVKMFDLPHLVSQAVEEKPKLFSSLTLRYYKLAVLISFPTFLTAYIIYALINREFLYRYWLPYDMQAMPNFEITFVFVVVTIVFGFGVFFLASVLMVAILTEIISQLQLLNHNLKNCAKNGESRQSQDHNCASANQDELTPIVDVLRSQNLQEETKVTKSESGTGLRCLKCPPGDRVNENIYVLRSCVRHHHAIIRLMTAFDNAFNSILLQSYICSLVPCLLSILFATYTSEFDTRALLFQSFTIFQLMNQFLFCWLGEKVNEQNILIREAVFSCDWLRESDGFKRSMRIMMSRCNQPLIIRMGGFIPLNLPTLHQLLQLIYSYYMSLKTTLDLKKH